MKSFSALAALCLAVASSAPALMGQAAPSHLGIAAGAVFPAGTFAKGAGAGFNVTGMMGIDPRTLPVGFRLEASFNSFGGKHGNPGTKISSANFNLVWTVPISGVAPYVIGGIAYYRHSGTIATIGNGAANNGGYNIGAGLRIPLESFDTIIQARYNHISESGVTTFVPVTFGIFF